MEKIRVDLNTSRECPQPSKPTDACCSPASLLDICLDFIAVHTHYVESLVDFPEVMGKTLFERAEKKGVFEDYHSENTVRSLQLFSFAYGPLMIENLNLEKFGGDVTDLLPIVSSMAFELTKLNLDLCCLGQDDENLQHISNIRTLQELSLRGNELTDTSLRILTSPMRILKRGPLSLKTLDLSGNPGLTDASARYLQCFSCIEALDLSGCKYRGSGLTKLEAGLGLLLDSNMSPLCLSYPCCNKGWAANIFTHWSNSKREEENKDENKDLNRFYGKSNFSRYACIKQRKKPAEFMVEHPVIRLRRVKSTEPHTAEPPQKRRKILSTAQLLEDKVNDTSQESQPILQSSRILTETGKKCQDSSFSLSQSVVDCYLPKPGQSTLSSRSQSEENSSLRSINRAVNFTSKTDEFGPAVNTSSAHDICTSKKYSTVKKKRRKIIIKSRLSEAGSSREETLVNQKERNVPISCIGVVNNVDCTRTPDVGQQNKPTLKSSKLFEAMKSYKW